MLGSEGANVNAAQGFGPGLGAAGATVRFVHTAGPNRHAPGPAGMRLAWVNPSPSPEEGSARADLRLVPHAPVPPRPVKLDLAIERHLTGADGLSRDQFLVAFSGRAFGTQPR